MPRPLLLLAAVPAILFIIYSVVPASLKESYAWMDPISLNTPASNGRPRRWFNMGYWNETGAAWADDFSKANENLAWKLREFANVDARGAVLAHGTGESLLVHLTWATSPARLDALTSIPSDTTLARALVRSHKVNESIGIPVEFYTGSAMPRIGNVDHQSHPLNPMKGFLGQSSGASAHGSYDEEDDGEEYESSPTGQTPATKGYDLIYILDAIYHLPPSIKPFLSAAYQGLAPGGAIAYTDILPPVKGLNPIIARIVSFFIGVPLPNLTHRPGGLQAYKAELESLGYDDVKVEDWGEHVWLGFATNLQRRGGFWARVGKRAKWAYEEAGWRFLAVRARRPDKT